MQAQITTHEHTLSEQVYKSLRGQMWFRKCTECGDYIDVTAERRSQAAKKAAATRKANDEACRRCYGRGGDRQWNKIGNCYIRVRCPECNGTGKRLEGTSNPFNVGDILTGSWGYDQTNVEFYQVIAASKATVTIQPVKTFASKDDGQSTRVYAAKDQLIGKPERRRVNRYGHVNMGHYSLSKWNGAGRHQTSFGAGH